MSRPIAICLSSLPILLSGCGPDASKPLGDGYLHAETDLYNTYVVFESTVVVESNVTHALAFEDFIVGLRTEPEAVVGPEHPTTGQFGYFVYDKTTGQLLDGLSEAEILEVFASEGWDFERLLDSTL